MSYMTVCINVDVLSRTKIYDRMQYRNIYVHVQSTCTSYLVPRVHERGTSNAHQTTLVYLLQHKRAYTRTHESKRAAETSLAHNKEGASCS